MKRRSAEGALARIEPLLENDDVLGVGTGSTVNFFIDLLPALRGRIAGAVASSEASAARLQEQGIPVFDLNTVDRVRFYVDGADEADPRLQLIKGGGGALTREKIIAQVAETFICIVDESKRVGTLGRFPLPVEVIPMARSLVGRELVRLGGDPVYRENFITDNGNIILDVHNLRIEVASDLESAINNIVGVVCNGLFAARPADSLVVGTADGDIETVERDA